MTVATYTADGSMADMATWSLSGVDMGDFTIPGGTLNFRNAPDYEMPIGGSGNDSNIYMVTVKAEAGGEMEMLEVTVDRHQRWTRTRDGYPDTDAAQHWYGDSRRAVRR